MRPLQVMVTGRRGGKTVAMLDWFLAGHRIGQHPGWSRVIICSDQARANEVAHQLLRTHAQLAWDNGFLAPIDLRKVIVSANTAKERLSGGAIDVETGVDDTEIVISQLLGVSRLDIVTMTGELFTGE